MHNHKFTDEYKCSECGKCFSSESVLKTHLKKHASALSKTYICPICSGRFKQ